MTVRQMEPRDIPALNAMAEASGFPYPALTDPMVETVFVVVDQDDVPLMGCAAKKLIETYLYSDLRSPGVKIAAIRALHERMGAVLKEKGYNSVEAFLPPLVERRFGHRLATLFGWTRNWNSWNRSLDYGEGK